MTTKLIRVLIVDDHQLIRYGLRSLLNGTEDIEVIGDVGTGEEAVEFARNTPPDVILMDIRMPGIGGLEATRKIVRSSPESRVLVITSCDVEPFPSSLLQVGATGFLSKDGSEEEMLTAVRVVASGEQYICSEVVEAMRLKILSNKEDSPFTTLSNKELQVALMLINGEKGKHIAGKMYIDSKTVSTYRTRIHESLNVNTDVELALLAVRYGIVDDVPEPMDENAPLEMGADIQEQKE